ncbi:hypothetical protein Q5424_01240 [Conexibacter sp. JD483]|uniref:hypothetical protein n=1 Tax=unclassified Conexibacter TaxID=2627773 RepID=UPI00271DF874|nr:MULTISPECIES: hypothetical protein [unclassified Conexibacter]MDO8185853.1 hypothetical protein [Conexibacter sp. CPCC 205706]MDO8198597.1 hypothetical protein [Conexibacter sp. CPCC 205762]MDR9367683.1 hypothetical protein [Conexibacter sp. JD483]
MNVTTRLPSEDVATLLRQRTTAAERLRRIHSSDPGPVDPALRQAFIAARTAATAGLKREVDALDDALAAAGASIELSGREIQTLPAWSAAQVTNFRRPVPTLGPADLVCGTGPFVYRATRPLRPRASMLDAVLQPPPLPDPWGPLKAPGPPPRRRPERFAFAKPLPENVIAANALEPCDKSLATVGTATAAVEAPSCGSETCRRHCLQPRLSRTLR